MLLLAVLFVAISASAAEEDIIDLQELLRNVSRSYQNFDRAMNILRQENADNAKLCIENFQKVITNANSNSQRCENIANEHGRRSQQSLAEVLDLLRGISKGVTDLGPMINEKCTGDGGVKEGKDCAELYAKGVRQSGVHTITPSPGQSLKVYCDMKNDGGGWTLFQRRGNFGNPQDYFYKTWNEYKNGFGDMEKEFWIGNDRLSELTRQRPYRLRVDLWDMEGNQAYAKYSSFKLDNEQGLYTLRIGSYSGTAGDSLAHHNNIPFSTKDRDNDPVKQNCAVTYQGAWWFYGCHNSNLNGLNVRGTVNGSGVTWFQWKNSHYSMAFAEMKMKPV